MQKQMKMGEQNLEIESTELGLGPVNWSFTTKVALYQNLNVCLICLFSMIPNPDLILKC